MCRNQPLPRPHTGSCKDLLPSTLLDYRLNSTLPLGVKNISKMSIDLTGSALLKSALRIHQGLREKVNSLTWQHSRPSAHSHSVWAIPTHFLHLDVPSRGGLAPPHRVSWLLSTSPVSRPDHPALQSFAPVRPSSETGSSRKGSRDVCHFPYWRWGPGARDRL